MICHGYCMAFHCYCIWFFIVFQVIALLFSLLSHSFLKLLLVFHDSCLVIEWFALLLHCFSWEGCPSTRLSSSAEHQKQHFCIIARGREQAMMWPDCRGGRAGRPARLPRQCGQTERVVIIRRKGKRSEYN